MMASISSSSAKLFLNTVFRPSDFFAPMFSLTNFSNAFKAIMPRISCTCNCLVSKLLRENIDSFKAFFLIKEHETPSMIDRMKMPPNFLLYSNHLHI